MHIYTSPTTGERLPSVSYIKSATTPIADIIRWNKGKIKRCEEQGLTEDEYEQIMVRSRDRGSVVHEWIEQMGKRIDLECNVLQRPTHTVVKSFIEGFNPDFSFPSELKQSEGFNDPAPYWQQFKGFAVDFFKEGVDILAFEKEVVSDKYRYGGRVDLVVKGRGDILHPSLPGQEINVLIDFKTFKGKPSWKGDGSVNHEFYVLKRNGRKKKKEKITHAEVQENIQKRLNPTWDMVSSMARDYFLQQVLYAIALRENGIPVHAIALVVLTQVKYQVVFMPMSMWQGARIDALNRVADFWENHADTWMAEVMAHVS